MPTLELLRAVLPVIRAHFGDEHVDVVVALIDMAPRRDKWTTRLTVAAYRKGLVAALSYDSMDAKYPDCPYDNRGMSNHARGANDPRQAWRHGSLDGQRIRSVVLNPASAVVIPNLLQREYRALTREMREAYDTGKQMTTLAEAR